MTSWQRISNEERAAAMGNPETWRRFVSWAVFATGLPWDQIREQLNWLHRSAS